MGLIPTWELQNRLTTVSCPRIPSMEDSDGFADRLRDVDARLEQIQRQNAASQLEGEISFLEQKLAELETQRSRLTSTPRPGAYDDYGPGRQGLRPPVASPLSTGEAGYLDGSDRQEPDRKHVTFKDDGSGSDGKMPGSGASSTKCSGNAIRPATYDGTGSWNDYLAHFEACSEINGWDDKKKGLYLAVSLRGQAQGVLGNLSGKTQDFKALRTALQERFAPPNQTELYRCQLRDRRQKASETLAELAQDVRRLANLAYPSAPSDLKETLAKEQFIDSLHSSDIRLKVKQARPSNLNDAVHHAIELEAFYRAEKRQGADRGTVFSATSTESRSEDNRLKETVRQPDGVCMYDNVDLLFLC